MAEDLAGSKHSINISCYYSGSLVKITELVGDSSQTVSSSFQSPVITETLLRQDVSLVLLSLNQAQVTKADRLNVQIHPKGLIFKHKIPISNWPYTEAQLEMNEAITEQKREASCVVIQNVK